MKIYTLSGTDQPPTHNMLTQQTPRQHAYSHALQRLISELQLLEQANIKSLSKFFQRRSGDKE